MILTLLLITVLAGLVIFTDWLKQIADENGRTGISKRSLNTLQVSYARGEINRAEFKAPQKELL
jgi:uncharacterized membrane protein